MYALISVCNLKTQTLKLIIFENVDQNLKVDTFVILFVQGII